MHHSAPTGRQISAMAQRAAARCRHIHRQTTARAAARGRPPSPAAARGRPPPRRDTGRSQRPAAPDADQLSQFSACRAPPPRGPRTPAGATRATAAARPRHQGQATQNATTGVRQPPHRAPPTHNKAGTPSTAAQGYQQTAPGAYQTIVFRQCSKYLQQNCAWMCARHQDQAA